MSWGDNMQTRWKNALISLILGIIFPGILFLAIANSMADGGPSEPTETQKETTLAKLTGTYSSVSVLMDNGEIEQMELDKYLTRVVLREMPAEFDQEALKAQAVVARTYTLRRIKTGGKHVGASVCTSSSCCQGYRTEQAFLEDGESAQLLEKVQKAVHETENQVLLYNGDLIEATYFSCSGGRTEDAVAVWGADIPYLQATDSPGEENANHYIDTVQFDTDEFMEILGVSADKGLEHCVQHITYTSGGGVDTITICGTEFSGTQVRSLLGLRSTSFVISIVGNRVTITTKGFGHRVGMSQYGAEAMAVAGSDYAEILVHYYKGTSLCEYSG